jgi:Flp pilus assembly protein TadD
MHSSNDILEQLELAEDLKLQGDHTEALAVLVELLVKDPSNVSALEEIADNELSLEHYDRSFKAAQQALKLDNDSYTALYILGFLASQKYQYEQALTHLQRANTLKPNNAEILRCLGWCLFCNNQTTKGIVTLERSLNLDTENPLTLCDLGVTYLQSQNFSKAKTLFQRALELDPDNARARECVEAAARLEAHMHQDNKVRQS